MSLLFNNKIKISGNLLKRCLSTVKEGSSLPNVVVYENTPANKVNIRDLFKGKKGLIFGVPGAFTPGYIENYDKIKSKGYDIVACVSVNDPFVMEAWGKAQNATNKVRLFADTNADLTKALGLGKELAVLGGLRSQRYTLVVNDNVVQKVFVEPDGTGLSCSLADNVLKQL